MEEAVAGLVAEQLNGIPVDVLGERRACEELLRASAEKCLGLRVTGIRESIEQGMARLRVGQSGSEGDVERLLQKVTTHQQLQSTIHGKIAELKGRPSAPPPGSNSTQVELDKAETKLKSLSSLIRDRRSQLSTANASITLTHQGSTNSMHRFKLTNLKYRPQSSLSLRITLEEAQGPATTVPLQTVPASGEIQAQAELPLAPSGSWEAAVVASQEKRCSNLVVFPAS